jgi:hypothetical protein
MKSWLMPVFVCGVFFASALPAHAFYVRGEAEIQGNNIPQGCPAIGTRFSRSVQTNIRHVCQAHATCTAAKVTAVNDWIAQLNQRNLGNCVRFVRQSGDHCQTDCP